eukprot:12922149-Prorocentrum_lima.AAC.1
MIPDLCTQFSSRLTLLVPTDGKTPNPKPTSLKHASVLQSMHVVPAGASVEKLVDLSWTLLQVFAD